VGDYENLNDKAADRKSRGFIAMLLGWLSKRLQFLLLASHFF
jgi:hypothetical protein